MMRYALIACLVALVGLGGAYGWQTRKVYRLEAKLSVTMAKLKTCDARISNIMEDQRSDAEIENIPDDSLGDFAERWLLPQTGTGD